MENKQKKMFSINSMTSANQLNFGSLTRKKIVFGHDSRKESNMDFKFRKAKELESINQFVDFNYPVNKFY